MNDRAPDKSANLKGRQDDRPSLACQLSAGRPADVDISAYPSLVALAAESYSKYRDLPAYECMGKSITFGDIDRLSRDLGAWLQTLGLKRAAIASPS